MRALAIKTETSSLGGLPPGCDLAVLGRIELHAGRLDGFALQVLISRRLDQMLTAESRQTGRSREETLGSLIDLSLYMQR